MAMTEAEREKLIIEISKIRSELTAQLKEDDIASYMEKKRYLAEITTYLLQRDPMRRVPYQQGMERDE